MADLAMAPILLREAFGPRRLVREPEPDLVMDGVDEVAAYTLVGRVDGPMAAAYLFHSARISLVIQGCKKVVDLACGPATQLCQVAGLHPETTFIGADLSVGMLHNARKHADSLGLKNVDFIEGDMTDLRPIVDHSVDGVISTVAFHHLPTLDHLRRAFREINRILVPEQGALYLVDFGRLKSAASVRYFAYKDRDSQPEVFCRDYENSLKAAFLFDEFVRLTRAELPRHARVYRTFATPFFTLIKSPDRTMAVELRQTLLRMRAELPRKYQSDLDDLRMFFRMGGLPNDPFSRR